MKGVTITDVDSDGTLTVDLVQILELIPRETRSSLWELSDVEAVGDVAEELHLASDSAVRLHGLRFLDIVRKTAQVVDGVFRAFEEGAEVPWLVVRAVDSSAYDVLTSRDDVLVAIRQGFRDVRPIPDGEVVLMQVLPVEGSDEP